MSGEVPDFTTSATPAKPARNRRRREYNPSGLYALQGALKRVEEGQDWTQALGPAGVALKAWRMDLIEALGGEATVSPQQRALVELATRTHLMVESVDRFILGMDSLVNKSRRCIFAVVKERQQLADALARYLGQLGLERRAKPAPSLAELLSRSPEPSKPSATAGQDARSPEPTSNQASGGENAAQGGEQ